MRALLSALLLTSAALAQNADFSGTWITDLGEMTIQQNGAKVTASYGPQKSMEGKVGGKTCKFTWREGRGSGSGEWTMQKGRLHFTGKSLWPNKNFRANWRGWKPDPKAAKGKSKFAGVWLSSLGTLVLEQKGNKVKGTWGSQGWATVDGTAKGRRLELTWKRLQWSGPAWIELTKDGKSFFGRTQEQRYTKWIGVKLPKEYKRKPRPKAGKIVYGITQNGICYFVRAPTGWKAGTKTDAIVLLHGSNWTTLGMVHVTARMKDLGKKYTIIGIQGETWADFSTPPDLRFNYTYVNWMGRSTYQGYPNTDRESPKLVADAVDAFRKDLTLDRIFIGGHSQGGYLAFILHMHYPEKFEGVFPMSCGLVMQAEPDVFKDDDKQDRSELRKAQRTTPLAIVHGTQDNVVQFSSGQYNFDRFAATGFPLMSFFAPARSHAYDFLPVVEVIEWLDAMSTKDPAVLQGYAEKRAGKGGWRDVAAACLRARALKKPMTTVEAKLDRAAAAGIREYLPLIKANKDNKWIDGFLRWRDQFEFAPSAAEVMTAFSKLVERHDKPAEDLYIEARKAFNNRDQNAGYAKYEEIVEKLYCARRCRIIKRWLGLAHRR